MTYRKLQSRKGAWGCGNPKCRSCFEWVTVETRAEKKEREMKEAKS
jgi:hypothetical protein